MFEVKFYGTKSVINILCSGVATNNVAHAIVHVRMKLGDKTTKDKNHNEDSFTWSGDWLLLGCTVIHNNYVLNYKDYFWSN